MTRQLRSLLVPASFLSVCSVSFAQQAQVQGQIADSTGSLIPRALVRVVDQRTGMERKVQSNGSGQYSIPGLDLSVYRVFVLAPGFSAAMSTPITLHVAQTAVLNFRLQVGSGHELVDVTASDLSMNTVDGSVSTVVDRKFVENIPLNGRSFQDLISMTPGVVSQSPQAGSSLGNNGDFSVNGQRTESNYYTVDGVSANGNPGSGAGTSGAGLSGNLSSSTALGTTQSLISVDALQEFRVQGSTYSAEYGRSPGGQFSFVTRSGTNRIHGTAYDYLRNNFFDANDWFNDHYKQPIAALRQNDFGGTVSGPVSLPRAYDGRNKTFFFTSYEGLRLVQPRPATIQYVPDASLRNGAAAALQPILNAFPLPTAGGIDYASGLAQFIQSYSLPSRIDSTSVRFDHSLSDKVSLFFRFSDTPSSSSSRVLSSMASAANNNSSYTLGATAHLSNTVNNEFRIGYLRTDALQNSTLDNFGGAKPIDFAQAMGVGGYQYANPSLLLFVPSVGLTSLGTAHSANRLRQWNVVDTMSKEWGHHQLRFGFDYLRTKSPVSPVSPSVQGEFYNATSLLPSLKSNQSYFVTITNSVGITPVINETAAFLQDQWQLKPRVSISAGLRWEINPAPTGADGQAPYTFSGTYTNPSSLVIAPRGKPLYPTTWYNFAPRLGVAWQAQQAPGWETVVRAGGGVFFDTDNRVATSAFFGPGFQATSTTSGASLPVTSAQLNLVPTVAPPYTSASVYLFPAHMQLPYTLQWNAAVQQGLGAKQSLTLSYVAAESRRLLGRQQVYLRPYNANFRYAYYYLANLTANYQSLQVQFQRTVSPGLQALASYTWSHALDFASSDPALAFQRGNSDLDLRHNVQGGLTWDLPQFEENVIARSVSSGWAIDGRIIARTGFPVTLYGSQLRNAATGNTYYSSVNYNPAYPMFLYGSQYPGGRTINGGPSVPAATAAFTLPSGSNLGNAPRNFIRGFGATQLNVAARRDFPLKESLRLQFRAEIFNLLNHPNFGNIDNSLYSATFGQATMMLNQSLGTTASQYQQGGARSMQFALKLLF